MISHGFLSALFAPLRVCQKVWGSIDRVAGHSKKPPRTQISEEHRVKMSVKVNPQQSGKPIRYMNKVNLDKDAGTEPFLHVRQDTALRFKAK